MTVFEEGDYINELAMVALGEEVGLGPVACSAVPEVAVPAIVVQVASCHDPPYRLTRPARSAIGPQKHWPES